jgi:hypothetical protein
MLAGPALYLLSRWDTRLDERPAPVAAGVGIEPPADETPDIKTPDIKTPDIKTPDIDLVEIELREASVAP